MTRKTWILSNTKAYTEWEKIGFKMHTCILMWPFFAYTRSFAPQFASSLGSFKLCSSMMFNVIIMLMSFLGTCYNVWSYKNTVLHSRIVRKISKEIENRVNQGGWKIKSRCNWRGLIINFSFQKHGDH